MDGDGGRVLVMSVGTGALMVLAPGTAVGFGGG